MNREFGCPGTAFSWLQLSGPRLSPIGGGGNWSTQARTSFLLSLKMFSGLWTQHAHVSCLAKAEEMGSPCHQDYRGIVTLEIGVKWSQSTYVTEDYCHFQKYDFVITWPSLSYFCVTLQDGCSAEFAEFQDFTTLSFLSLSPVSASSPQCCVN